MVRIRVWWDGAHLEELDVPRLAVPDALALPKSSVARHKEERRVYVLQLLHTDPLPRSAHAKMFALKH
jgi:hypothetical protein